MQIDIHTHDKQLAYDLLGRTSIQSGDQLSLADGVTLEFQRTTKRYSIDLPDVVTFALTVIGSVPAAVATNLLTDFQAVANLIAEATQADPISFWQ